MSDKRAVPRGSQYVSFDGSGLTLLLVDDHESSRLSLERLLLRRGFKVIQSDTVRGGLSALARHRIDILLADIGLPDGSGYELLEKIDPKAPMASIALTGFGTVQDLEMSRKAGFSIHLTKPIRMEALDTALGEALQQLRSKGRLG